MIVKCRWMWTLSLWLAQACAGDAPNVLVNQKLGELVNASLPGWEVSVPDRQSAVDEPEHGKVLKIEVVELDRMDWLVEGVDGKARG